MASRVLYRETQLAGYLLLYTIQAISSKLLALLFCRSNCIAYVYTKLE